MNRRQLPFTMLTLLIVISISCSPKKEITTGTLLDEMMNREQLAEFPDPEYTTKQFSSYDRRSIGVDQPGWFANADRSQFIRTEKANGRREFVLFDAEGPGAIVRFWVTVALYEGNGTLRVYLDHDPTPVIEGEVLSVMSGGAFLKGPLATSVSDLTDYIQRGHNLYLPIPYSQHCKITYESDGVDEQPGAISGEAFYYNINYRTYTDKVSVSTFTKDDLRIYADELETIDKTIQEFDAGLPLEMQTYRKGKATLAVGEKSDIVIEGTQAVRKLTLRLDAANAEQALRSTVLGIAFDGQQTVWCPVGDFFGTGYKLSPYSSRYTRVLEDGTMSCSWVMPFAENCRIALGNLGDQVLNIAEFSAQASPYQRTDRTMYFGAGWKEEERIATRIGEDTGAMEDQMFDVNYVDLDGKGVLIGNGVTLFNTIDAWWGEGDEKIFVDGEVFPSHFGTGSEDFYGYAWSNPNAFSHPFIAQPDGTGAMVPGYAVNLRYRALDAIPFTTGLKFDMEMWHQGSTIVNYAPVTYWYMFPEGNSNLKADPEQAAKPVALSRLDFFLEGYEDRNIFIGEATVSIDGRENGYEIRYTLDGSEPTKNSMVYDGPFRLNRSATVKSKGFSKKGYETATLVGEFINQKPFAGTPLTIPKAGLKYDYYVLDDVLESTQELYDLDVQRSSVVESITYPSGELPLKFGLIFRGYIHVKKRGVYTFYTISNDGSRVYIQDQLVVDNDGPHGARERFGQVALAPGYHPIKVEYKQIGGSKHLEAFVKEPGKAKRLIEAEELFQ